MKSDDKDMPLISRKDMKAFGKTMRLFSPEVIESILGDYNEYSDGWENVFKKR